MSLPVLVLGGGGHAKVLIEALRAMSVAVTGIADPDPELHGVTILGVTVLGGDEVVCGFTPYEILLVNALGSVGLPVARQKSFEYFKREGYVFATVIHPAAVIASDVELGEGVQVMAGAIIQPGSRVGCNVIINTSASVDHDCVIGDHVHLAPGVTLSGGVEIGEGTHVGTAAVVIQGIHLGSHCLVAAGSVVVRDVADGSTVKGVPARVVAKRNSTST
jgi:UDP-perosamine 4-acetyltransferase